MDNIEKYINRLLLSTIILLAALIYFVPLAQSQTIDQPVGLSMPAEDSSAVSAFTSAGTGTYFTAVAATTYDGVIIQNKTDSIVIVSFDGGTTDHFSLDNGENLSINFRQHGLRGTGAISLKDDGTAPTSGTVKITLIK